MVFSDLDLSSTGGLFPAEPGNNMEEPPSTFFNSETLGFDLQKLRINTIFGLFNLLKDWGSKMHGPTLIEFGLLLFLLLLAIYEGMH